MITPDETHYCHNYNAYPVKGQTVIIHATRSGHYANPTEFRGTINYMMGPGNNSSHWVVSRTGIKVRMVSDSLQAWHAGSDNPRAWGIELEQGTEAEGFTTEQFSALVAICQSYIKDFNVPPIHASLPWGPGFIGHQETLQGRSFGKSDPGHLFPWNEFIASLNPAQDIVDGIGVTLDDGTDLGNILPALPPGRTVAGIGVHLTPSEKILRLWP